MSKFKLAGKDSDYGHSHQSVSQSSGDTNRRLKELIVLVKVPQREMGYTKGAGGGPDTYGYTWGR